MRQGTGWNFFFVLEAVNPLLLYFFGAPRFYSKSIREPINDEYFE